MQKCIFTFILVSPVCAIMNVTLITKKFFTMTRPGKHLGPVAILAFTQDPALCPVVHIRHYIQPSHVRTV